MSNAEFRDALIRESLDFARQIARYVDSMPNKRSSWVIGDQLMRSASSIGANIVEAQAASSRADFTNFLNHALKSCNETRYWLLMAMEVDPVRRDVLESHLATALKLSKIMGASLASLRKTRRQTAQNVQ